MTKKQMTIEDLAKRMDKGFGNVNSRIGSVEKNINSRIDSVNSRIDSVNSRIDSVNSRIDSTKNDLSKKIDKDTEFLARITQDGFREAETKHNKAHKIIRKRIRDAESGASGIRKIAMSKVERDDGQDLEIKEVKTRVQVLEKQVL